MSTQSGITTNPELIEAFKQYITNGDRALYIKIENEQLIPSNVIKGTSSLDSDFDLISNELNEYDCSFIIIKNDEVTDKHIFINYVPDNSQVKQKMLYASTKNTLLRELGTEFFSPILFINELEEISSKGWDAIKKHEASENPLSAEEESLQVVKNMELLSIGSSRAKPQLVTDSSRSLGMNLDVSLIQDLKNTTSNELVTLIIGEDEKIIIYKKSSISEPQELTQGKLLNTQPNFNIVKFGDNLYFIYTCPSGSKVRERMVYASSKLGLLTNLKSNGFEFKKVIEVGDADEIELSEFDDSQTTEVATPTPAANGLRFSKPKGPRRR
ncbi:hypothetical protein CANARDRAFT_29759, partial [[Candida] arabinofermentans NRRL YB-2248]